MRFSTKSALFITGLVAALVMVGCGGDAISSPAPSKSLAPGVTTSKQSGSNFGTGATSTASTTTEKSTASASGSSTSATVSVDGKKVKTSTSQPAKPNYNSSLTSLLKVDNQTLQQQLQAGKSLADVAKAHSVDEQQVVDLLVQNEKQVLDKEVSAGKLTQAQEDKRLSTYPTQIKKVVEAKHTNAPKKP